jgi:hypothetical protein
VQAARNAVKNTSKSVSPGSLLPGEAREMVSGLSEKAQALPEGVESSRFHYLSPRWAL